MPLKSGYGKKTFAENLAELLSSGYNRKQALAISYNNKRKAEKEAGKPVTPKK